MKVINIILTLLFILFAAVQLNDPDPWLWVAIYGLVAGVSGFAIFQKLILVDYRPSVRSWSFRASIK